MAPKRLVSSDTVLKKKVDKGRGGVEKVPKDIKLSWRSAVSTF